MDLWALVLGRWTGFCRCDDVVEADRKVCVNEKAEGTMIDCAKTIEGVME